MDLSIGVASVFRRMTPGDTSGGTKGTSGCNCKEPVKICCRDNRR